MLYHDFSLIFSLLSFLFLDHLGVDTYMITPYLNLSICVFHQDVDTFLDNLSTVISLRKLTLVKYLASHYRCNTRQCSLSQYLQFSCSTHFHPGFILHIVVAYYSLPSFELLLVLATFFPRLCQFWRIKPSFIYVLSLCCVSMVQFNYLLPLEHSHKRYGQSMFI